MTKGGRSPSGVANLATGGADLAEAVVSLEQATELVPVSPWFRAMLRGEQDEKSASIGMRKCGRMRDEGRA